MLKAHLLYENKKRSLQLFDKESEEIMRQRIRTVRFLFKPALFSGPTCNSRWDDPLSNSYEFISILHYTLH